MALQIRLNPDIGEGKVMECPNCKYQNRPDADFCANCGMALKQSAPLTAGTVTVGGTTGGTRGTSRALTIGTPLQGGRYVITKILGEGGMGAAMVATDKRLDNKPVVIKELISDNSDPAKFKEDERNFKREVTTLAHLDHPLIPNVTDSFQEGSHYFMVQEYVEGENLEQRLERLKKPIPEREALGYASQVLDVLEYLAQQTPPVVHRDIKPANIIIGSKDKRAHLVDFGIARADAARNARRKQTSALGTPGYAPPEQYQGNADPRSDLYALGATLHHILTNRDPRDYAPFSYPPARTLNPQISPETERVLSRALNNDITQRYQSATAMKRDIDDILYKRFGVSGNISSYTLGASGPIAAVGVAGGANSPAQARSPQPAPLTPLPPVNQSQAYAPAPVSNYPPPPQPRQQRSNHFGRNFLIFVLVIFLIALAAYAALSFVRGRGTNITSGTTPTPTPGISNTPPANGIGGFKAPDGEIIGISDGSVAFDSSRPSGYGYLKTQAAADYRNGDIADAMSLWEQEVNNDTSDAESLIYLEDQRVLSGGSPYITIIIGTMISGDNVGVGRDDLQGAYVAQKEYNDGVKLGGTLVRLLIANSGNQTSYATLVAQQIVKAAHSDATIVGVMGWPFSSRTSEAVKILSAAHIPMVSQTASADSLTNISPYFFRVAPPNSVEGVVGAHYAETTLHAKNVALFVDPDDPYSSTLAADFSKQFTADGNRIVVTEHYTVGQTSNLPSLLNNALSQNPDLIYFSGYSNDVAVLLQNLPTSGPFATLQILGGDALYELGGYPPTAHAGFDRLRFTSFAYPDEWDVLKLTAQKPVFFQEYPLYFNPKGRTITGSPYGYTRADNDVMLSYDAMLAILHASANILQKGPNSKITPASLQQALSQINGPNAFQGVSGQIAFGPDGNPINKAMLILYVAQGGFIHMESSVAAGTFLVQG
ncbi:MAG TPA: ABC transporter substrate-binding protein [Ktedonobacteraceae bacterium]|jgi:serine/threonine protein kinase/ABC-type branched-subunit amino acid transport system substrate-binding protein|nr:ABC transporter substrate-binding protein [Ktedonobacteraceae bacterium]